MASHSSLVVFDTEFCILRNCSPTIFQIVLKALGDERAIMNSNIHYAGITDTDFDLGSIPELNWYFENVFASKYSNRHLPQRTFKALQEEALNAGFTSRHLNLMTWYSPVDMVGVLHVVNGRGDFIEPASTWPRGFTQAGRVYSEYKVHLQPVSMSAISISMLRDSNLFSFALGEQHDAMFPTAPQRPNHVALNDVEGLEGILKEMMPQAARPIAEESSDRTISQA